MKRVNKLAAAVALALCAGVASQASAEIMHKQNGIGDALLFPTYMGVPGVDNYFTISNSSDKWIQGHLRFRGAAWTGEVRDLDVILSPGDVFVFRLTNKDVGDAQSNADAHHPANAQIDEWEIDQSLDQKNFAYTGQTYNCGNIADCLKPNFRLVPSPAGKLDAATIIHQKQTGYVEFIGEAVLDNMTHEIMADLLSGNTSATNKLYKDDLYARTGTNAWRWSNGEGGFRDCTTFATRTTAGHAGGGACDNGLSDVGNWLSGTAFVVVAGSSQGIAYNAEALADFRTSVNPHRVDTYSKDSSVIVHHDTSAIDDFYAYYPADINSGYEALISFNNTWGPTLADGDDYDVSDRYDSVLFSNDDFWDSYHGQQDSIAEVDLAFGAGGAQTYTSYYLAGGGFGGDSLTSHYFAWFPTKFYRGESNKFLNDALGRNPADQEAARIDYSTQASVSLVALGKAMNLEIWDINEVPGGAVKAGCISPDPCSQSVAASLGHELSFFSIDWFKQVFNSGTAGSFTNGRVVMEPAPGYNDPMGNPMRAFPMMSYTFEVGGPNLINQWRTMNH